MKKIHSITITIIALFLCISLCACSGLTNVFKSGTYNTEPLESGYTEVKDLTGVTFAVPSEYKDNSVSEMEYIEKMLKVQSGEEEPSSLMKTTFELKNASTYMLMNYSKFLVTVDRVYLSKDLSEFENTQMLWDELNVSNEKELVLSPNNKHLNSSINGEDKMLCSVSCKYTSKDYDESFSYEGYIALIENKQNQTFMMIVLSNDDNAHDISKYVAKSLDFTGENISNQNTSNTDETKNNNAMENLLNNNSSEDNNKEVNEEKDNDKDKNKDTEKPSNTSKNNSKLKDFKLTIDGKSIKLPIKMSELLDKLNLQISENDKNITLKKDTYTFAFVENPDDDFCFMVGVINAGDKDSINIKDAQVFSISADKYDIYGYGSNLQTTHSIVLPCNVVVSKTTKDEVIKAYGKPDETVDNDDSNYIYLTWDLNKKDFDYQTQMEITIDKETNLVYDFSYAKLPY